MPLNADFRTYEEALRERQAKSDRTNQTALTPHVLTLLDAAPQQPCQPERAETTRPGDLLR